MNKDIIRKIGEALESLSRGRTVQFYWCGECITVTADDAPGILDGIRYLLGGGSWSIFQENING